MRARLMILGAICVVTTGAAAVPAILPLKKLRLYETGIGYFERVGTPSSTSRMALPVPAGHLDDALKSLVVLSADGKATVQGVQFGSSVSSGMARSLAGLPHDGESAITHANLMAGLKGALVEVRATRRTIKGRLMDVEQESAPPQVMPLLGAAPVPVQPAHWLTLILLTPSAEIVRVRTTEVESVRVLDAGKAGRLQTAVDSLSAQRQQASKLLELKGAGTGPVTLGYMAETPLWRTTYRMVFRDDGKSAVLQAWALLHNDTDEDWRDVQVELVNGRPDSFLFPLAAPRYARRELVHPDEPLSTVPQLLGTSADQLWDPVEGHSSQEGLGLSGIGTGGSGYGYGSGSGSVTLGSRGAAAADSESSLLAVGNLAAAEEAKGVESGALFIYRLPAMVELAAHSSTLVPFMQQAVEARAVSLMERPGLVARSAVRFTNSTTQTLPVGPIAFFADGGFAGESALDRLKPKEVRFITFGADPDAELTLDGSQVRNVTRRLRFSDDTMEEHFVQTKKLRYRIVNRSGRPKTLALMLEIGRNATVTGVDAVERDPVTERPVILFEVPAASDRVRDVSTVEGLVHRMPRGTLDAAKMRLLATSAELPAAEKAIALEAAARLDVMAAQHSDLGALTAELAEVDGDLIRLREHVKALGEAGRPAAAPLVQRMLANEDKLLALRKKQEVLKKNAAATNTALGDSLKKLAAGQ